MTKILNIVTRMNIGGVALHVAMISELFNDSNYSSTILYGQTPGNEQDMLYLLDGKGLQTIFLPAMSRSINPLLDFRTVWQVYREIKRLEPDIVHTHTAKAGFAGRLAAWLAGVPIIIHTFHGNNFNAYFGRVMSTVSIVTERFLALLSSRIIAISEQQKQELLKYKIASVKKIRIIPLGFELSKLQHKVEDSGTFKAAWGINTKSYIVSFVGRLTAIKNPYEVLNIAKQVTKQRTDVVFVLAGDGELADSLKQEVCKLGLQEHIIFTGFIKDLKPLYADSEILLLTSMNEGTPVSIIEAMANKVLVLASRVGGIPNLITHGESGLLCPAKDTDCFARHILDYLEAPGTYKQMKEKAYSKVTEVYAAQRLENDLKALFEELEQNRKHK